MAFTYNQGNPLAGTTTATGKPNPATTRVKDIDKTPAPTFTGPAKYSPFPEKAPSAPTPTPTPKSTTQVKLPVEPSGGSAVSGGVSDTGRVVAPEPVVPQEPKVQEPTKPSIIPNVAYDTISKILEGYGISGLASVLEQIRKEYPEASSDDIVTLLQFDTRYNAKFNERFSANAARQKAGYSVLSPKEYLALEQGYKKIFDAYGLTKFKTQDYYNSFIGGDVKVTEVADRVSLAYDRVLNDIPVQTAFKQFYPSLVTTDIVSAMLDPINQFPALERKVKASEIGGAALRQGLSASEFATEAQKTSAYSNVTSASLGADVLAQQGVTKAGAEAGYSKIAQELPTAEKLSSIYGTTAEQYGRLESEQAQLQGLASAQRKKEKLVQLEAAQFGKSSGLSKVSLTGRSPGGLL